MYYLTRMQIQENNLTSFFAVRNCCLWSYILIICYPVCNNKSASILLKATFLPRLLFKTRSLFTIRLVNGSLHKGHLLYCLRLDDIHS